MAYIFSTNSSTLLSGTNYSDTIYNGGYDKEYNFHDGGEQVTIYGGKGNDSIRSYGYKVRIFGNEGNDTIQTGGDKYGVVFGEEGDDYILVYGDNISDPGSLSNMTISGGTGNDDIYNYSSNVTINSGADNDTVENKGNNVSIFSGDGNDTIKNDYGYEVTISGGKSDDYISLGDDARNSLIKYAFGDGNDTIIGFNSDDTLYITKGSFTTVKSGNDFIVKVGKQKIILKDALADGYSKINIKNSKGKVSVYNDWKVWNGSIYGNYAKNVTLAGSKKNDTLANASKYVQISGGNGDDSITNSSGDNTTISGGDGDDTINSYSGEKVIISGGNGNDSIYNSYYGDKVTISGGKGHDTVSNDGSDAIISCGEGNDSVNNSGDNTTILGGNGNDSIFDYSGDHITISGDKGNDSISLGYWSENTLFKYASGDGNDTIIGFNSDDTLHITKGSFTTVKSGNDFVVKVGKQKIILKDALADDYNKINIKNSKGKVSVYNDWKIIRGDGDTLENNYAKNIQISGGNGNDTLKNNYGDEVTISGGIGDDKIKNSSGDKVKISGGSGDDSIANYSGEKAIIFGDKGNDSIYNSGDNAIIYCADGNDSVNNFGDNTTILGGNGNDSIKNYHSDNVTISGGNGKDLISITSYAKNNVIQYASGDGNDTIFGFNYDDTLQITKGSYSVSTKNNDVIVKVGSSLITLKDAKGRQISIKNSKGKVMTKTYGSSSAQTAELFAENNFATADNLSEIVKNNLTATDYKIDTQNFENLTQKNNLITFAEK